MNTRHLLFKVPVLGLATLGVWQLAATPAGAAGEKKATTSLSVPSLAEKRGPTPPVGATFTGVESQPMVGELKLPIKDAHVYKFDAKMADDKTIPVNWAYTPGKGTYMWGTTKIQCANSTKVEQGGFAMEVHDDGSGAYALGTRKCPVAAIYGCQFDSAAMETKCGLCTWNHTELACVSDSGG